MRTICDEDMDYSLLFSFGGASTEKFTMFSCVRCAHPLFIYFQHFFYFRFLSIYPIICFISSIFHTPASQIANKILRKISLACFYVSFSREYLNGSVSLSTLCQIVLMRSFVQMRNFQSKWHSRWSVFV